MRLKNKVSNPELSFWQGRRVNLAARIASAGLATGGFAGTVYEGLQAVPEAISFGHRVDKECADDDSVAYAACQNRIAQQYPDLDAHVDLAIISSCAFISGVAGYLSARKNQWTQSRPTDTYDMHTFELHITKLHEGGFGAAPEERVDN